MEALERLRQIGIKKINQDTKISVGVIENILEKRFDKIQKVWIVGFLPIIEREYQIDLSQWMEEYNAYLLENSIQQAASGNAYQIKELELDTQKQRYDRNRHVKMKFGKVWQFVVIGILILLFLVYKFFIGVEKTSYIDYTNETPVVEKKDQTQIDVNSYANLAVSENTDSVQEKNVDTQKQQQGIYSSLEDGMMVIEPKREIWFQIWNLETNVKQDKIIKEPYRFKIPKQKSIIIFGHKSFKMRYGNEIKDYVGGDSIRFLCENGNIEHIRYSDYVKLVNATKKKFENVDLKKNADNQESSKKQVEDKEKSESGLEEKVEEAE